MPKKKFFAVVVIFIVYCIILVFISVNYKSATGTTTENKNMVQLSAEEDIKHDIDLLSPEVYKTAFIEGKDEADTPWKNNIELLSDEYPEQGLFMMPGTVITYTVQRPEKLFMAVKNYDSMAELGISDGMTLVIDIVHDGKSIKTYDPIVVSSDGQVKDYALDLKEWMGRTVQLRIHCYDGGNNDAIGDWCVIKTLKLVRD